MATSSFFGDFGDQSFHLCKASTKVETTLVNRVSKGKTLVAKGQGVFGSDRSPRRGVQVG